MINFRGGKLKWNEIYVEVVFFRNYNYTLLYCIIFCRFIAVCRQQLGANCRLPTAMKNTAKRPV